MKKIALTSILTAAVTAGAFAGLGFGRERGVSPVTCGIHTVGIAYKEYVCTLHSMPTTKQGGFELRLPVIDLRCDAYPVDPADNLPAFFSCDRLSLPVTKCVDGIFGSWAATMSARRFEVDSPQKCVTQAKSPGYKLTSGYTPHYFTRNP